VGVALVVHEQAHPEVDEAVFGLRGVLVGHAVVFL
jgi:hypothetical protein